MKRLLAKLALAVILLVGLRQHTPPMAAYSLRPLPNAEKTPAFRLRADSYGQNTVMVPGQAALREIRVYCLDDGTPVVAAYEYIVDNFKKSPPGDQLAISEILGMIKAAAQREVDKRVQDGLLPSEKEWRKKAVLTIMMSSLPTLKQSLLEMAEPGPWNDIKNAIDAQVWLLAGQLRETNRKLLISEDDFGFRHLTPAPPVPAAVPSALADPSGAI